MSVNFYTGKPNIVKVSTNGKCGPLNNYTKCPNNECCSSAGICNDTVGKCHMKLFGQRTGDWLSKYDGTSTNTNKKVVETFDNSTCSTNKYTILGIVLICIFIAKTL